MRLTAQQYFALRLIDLYQQRISPRKGFVCAHNALHHEGGCSGFGKTAIAGYGVVKGIGLTAIRLIECTASAAVLQVTSLDPVDGRGHIPAKPSSKQNEGDSAMDKVTQVLALDCMTQTACCMFMGFC